MNPKAKALKNQGAPTPFQMVGSAVKGLGRGIQKGLNKGVKSLVEPSVRVNRIKNTQMQEMDRKAKAGEYNY